MSEPQAEREIMDVLSSIRRLVSEDRRAKPAPLAERVEPQLAPPVSQAQALDDSTPHVDNAHAENRLVLTPALRVDALPEGASGWAEDARREAQAADGAGSLEATIAELEAAVAEIEADFEPDGGELVPLDLEEVPPPTWPSPEPAPVAYHGIMAGFEDMAAPEERQDWPVANMGGEGLVPLVPHPHGPDEAEDAPSDLQGDAPLVYGSKAQAVEVASEVPTSEDAMPLGKASFVHVASSAPPLGEQPAEGTSARPTIFRHDAALHEYGMVGASAQEEEDAADDLFDPLTGSDLDLSALRDIVAEMIRDELRGTLGERITRNLRTLVRREIARALAEEGPKGN